MVLAGVGCMVFPLASVMTIGKIVGAAMLVSGVGTVISCIMDKKHVGRGIVGGLIAIAGFMTLLDAFTTIAAVDILVTVFAVFTLFSGVTEILLACSAKEMAGRRAVVVISGVLNVILALLVLANPFTGLLVADCMIAFELMMTGGILISLGFSKPEMKIQVTETSEETVEA